MSGVEKSGSLLSTKAKLSRGRLALYGGLTAAVGIIVVVVIFAATSSLVVEAESGTLSGPAAITTVASASGGKAVQFGGTSSTPSPTPTGTQTRNCAPAPANTMTNTVSHLCGYADTTNTGVPAGTALIQVPAQATSGPGWTWNTGGWVDIRGDNAVFSGYEVHASVNIYGNGVTVQNCRIVDTGNDIGIGVRHANNAVIQHNTISGATNGGADDNRLTIAIKDVYGDVTNLSAIGNNIWDTSAGMTFDSGLMEGNYIHDMGYNSADHVDAVQSFGKGTLLVQHNTLLNQVNQTAAILWSTTLGQQGDHTVKDNLLAGGGYTIYGGGTDDGTDNGTANQVFTGNHFSRMFYANSGSYGATDRIPPSGTDGNLWSGNIWDDTGATVNP